MTAIVLKWEVINTWTVDSCRSLTIRSSVKTHCPRCRQSDRRPTEQTRGGVEGVTDSQRQCGSVIDRRRTLEHWGECCLWPRGPSNRGQRWLMICPGLEKTKTVHQSPHLLLLFTSTALFSEWVTYVLPKHPSGYNETVAAVRHVSAALWKSWRPKKKKPQRRTTS